MKKINASLILVLAGSMFLVACQGAGTTIETTYKDITSESIYGQLTDFDKEADEVKPGDTLTFKVTPNKYFEIDEVTNNGQRCRRVTRNDDGSAIYSTVIQEGLNRLKGAYSVDPTIDFVDEFKLEISDDVFQEVISKTKQKTGDKTKLDFRRSGIEQVGAPLKFDKNGKKVNNTDSFINYVDGDTTHVETLNLGYTVKIRYLSIDTPESTSEIEEWGLSASNYSKYIYTGDETYKNTLVDTTDFTNVQAGVTSLILIGQDASIHASEMTIGDLKIDSTEQGTYPATTDGNQRSLAYVWYATKQNPTKNDFRCLNLEMVYQGFSFGAGSRSETSDYVYRMFDAANLSAQANQRHLWSNLIDNNYYDYETRQVQNLSLRRLYETATTDTEIGYYPESPFCDKKTLYRVEGYVSRRLSTAFYIQDKPSYTQAEIDAGECYGLYVFTYSETPIRPGDKVSVIGAISSYGGTFQMQGISYHDLNVNPNRDTQIISTSRYTIEPIKLTAAEFNSKKLPQVLVEIIDNVWFYDFTSEYNNVAEPLGEGGSEEINKYNEAYPFYNTSNAPIFYASYGATDNAASLNSSNQSNTKFRYSDKLIRFTVDQDILVKSGPDTCYSYRFFTGGQYIYNYNGAEYANYDDDNLYKTDTITRTFARKAALYNPDDPVNPHGIIVISCGYESTGGNKKMTAKICSGSDVVLTALNS